MIAALHRDLGKDWTLSELAAEMGSSRSVFAERFLTVTDVTPVRYLTELRMRLAAQWLAVTGCRSKPPRTVSALDHTLPSVGRSSG